MEDEHHVAIHIRTLSAQVSDESKLSALDALNNHFIKNPNTIKLFAHSKGIPPLISLLTAKNSNIQLLSLEALACIASYKHSYSSNVIKKGAVKHVVTLPQFLPSPPLRPSPSPLHLCCIRLIKELAHHDPAALFQYINANHNSNINNKNNTNNSNNDKDLLTMLAMHLKAALMQPAHDSQMTRACATDAFASLARNTEYHEPMMRADCIELLILVLRSTPPGDPCAASAANALAHLAKSTDLRIKIAKAEAIPVLVSMLYTTVVHPGVSAALRALSHLAINADNQETMINVGVVPLVVSMLQEPLLRELAAESLQFLTYKNQKSQQQVINAGGLQILMDMLKSSELNLKAKAALAIFFLVQQRPHQDLAAACIPLLVNLMTSSSEEAKLNAIKALGSLANKHPQNKRTLSKSHGISHIVKYLKSNTKKRAEATEALKYLVGDPMIDKTLVNEGGLQLLMDMMQSSDLEKAAASETLSAILEPKTDPTSIYPSTIIHYDIPQLDDFVLKNTSVLIPILKKMLSCETKIKCGAVRLLSVFATLNVPFSVNSQNLVELINAGGTYATYAMRAVHHSFFMSDYVPTGLKDAIPGLITASHNIDPAFSPAHQKLAIVLIMRLLADPSTVAEVAPKVEIHRLIAELAYSQQPLFLHLGIDALWTVLENDVKFEKAVVQSGGIQPVARVLASIIASKARDDDLLRATLSIIRILAFEFSDELAHEGILNHLLGIIMGQESMELCSLALQALWVAMVSGSTEARMVWVKEGGVDMLVELIGRNALSSQGKLYAEQSLYLLRSAGCAGYSSLTDDNNYHRVCCCLKTVRVRTGSFQEVQEKAQSRSERLVSMYKHATIDLMLHTTNCNFSNEPFVTNMLNNVLLYIKNISEKVVKELSDTESWLSFISHTLKVYQIWLQPDQQLNIIGVKLFMQFLEKGLKVPDQVPITETLAMQARGLPRIEDPELRTDADFCFKALNTAARYPEKDPFYSQLAELRGSQQKHEAEMAKVTAELKEKSAQLAGLSKSQEKINEQAEKISEQTAKIQDLEAQILKNNESVKKVMEEKKKVAEDVAAKERKVNDLELENSKLKDNLRQEVAAAEKRVSDLNRKLQKAKNDVGEKRAQKEAEKDHTIAELKAELAKVKATITAQHEEYEGVIEKVSLENVELNDRLLTIERQLQDKQRTLQNLQHAQSHSHSTPSSHPSSSGGNNKLVEALTSLNIVELNDINAIDTMEVLLDQTLNSVRSRKYTLHKRQLEALKEQIYCPICMAKNRNIALTPCGHTFCSDCAKNIGAIKKCPICRKATKGTQPFYL